jgi:anti-sigma factor RsiW
MNCSFDLKQYALGESSGEEARRVATHVAECDACREELSRLELTQASLLALRDEEIPRRIAFVSDRVFEPRWYQRWWNSAPRLGFLSAAILACAILVHAFAGPGARPSAVVAVDAKAMDERIQREVTARLDEAVRDAVTRAVAASEARQSEKTAQLLQAAEKRYEFDRRATYAAFAEQARQLQLQVNSMYVVAQNMRSGE